VRRPKATAMHDGLPQAFETPSVCGRFHDLCDFPSSSKAPATKVRDTLFGHVAGWSRDWSVLFPTVSISARVSHLAADFHLVSLSLTFLLHFFSLISAQIPKRVGDGYRRSLIPFTKVVEVVLRKFFRTSPSIVETNQFSSPHTCRRSMRQ
jgi:hypothetical protein